ncbi:MAG: hypothetical protein A2Z49_08400 [Chloroflexi bacterium RBG_19FT_COMBO_56_12]|nr:MAG: hypothetical protein A2Z49_08400 [Chloroflexi bacterium RBG_19FT_COMBO_56_12]
MIQALILALLTWLNLIQTWHIMVLSFVLGAATAMEQPARLAFVMDTVGKEDITGAVALNSSTYNVGRIVGPAIAGILVAWTGEAGCFLINGISYFAVILALLAIRLPPHVRLEKLPQVRRSLASGFRYTWNFKVIRSLLVIVVISSFFILPYLALMPVFARDVLKTGPEGLGFLMTAVGIGAIGGALVVASLRSGSRGKWLAWGNIFGPVFLVLFCFSHSFWISLALVFLVGFGNALRQTLANSLIQVITEEEYRGRVMSIFYLLYNGTSQVGALGFGALADWTSAPIAVGLGSGISVILGLLVAIGMPEVRRLP